MENSTELKDSRILSSFEDHKPHHNNPENKFIAIIGAEGYQGSYIAFYLLERGYNVIAVVEIKSRELLRKHLKEFYQVYKSKIQIREANVLNMESLKKSIEGSNAIISLWPHEFFKMETDVLNAIYQPVEHVQLVFEIAKSLDIKRVVLSGSICSVISGNYKKKFDESDWAKLNYLNPEEKARLYAERMAWYRIEEDKYNIDQTVLNLGIQLGPSIVSHTNYASAAFMKKLFSEKLRYTLKIQMPIVDVRDAAIAFCKCLYKKATYNKRIIITQGAYSMEKQIDPLYEEFRPYGYKLPRSVLGKLPAFFMSFIDENISNIYQFVGKKYTIDTQLAENLLKIKYRDMDETLIEMVYNLIDREVIKDYINKKKGKKGETDNPTQLGSVQNLLNLPGQIIEDIHDNINAYNSNGSIDDCNTNRNMADEDLVVNEDHGEFGGGKNMADESQENIRGDIIVSHDSTNTDPMLKKVDNSEPNQSRQ